MLPTTTMMTWLYDNNGSSSNIYVPTKDIGKCFIFWSLFLKKILKSSKIKGFTVLNQMSSSTQVHPSLKLLCDVNTYFLPKHKLSIIWNYPQLTCNIYPRDTQYMSSDYSCPGNYQADTSNTLPVQFGYYNVPAHTLNTQFVLSSFDTTPLSNYNKKSAPPYLDIPPCHIYNTHASLLNPGMFLVYTLNTLIYQNYSDRIRPRMAYTSFAPLDPDNAPCRTVYNDPAPSNFETFHLNIRRMKRVPPLVGRNPSRTVYMKFVHLDSGNAPCCRAYSGLGLWGFGTFHSHIRHMMIVLALTESVRGCTVYIGTCYNSGPSG